jgi:hydroxymethylpyrimidine/phosphomethylpyrimidine kinase
LSIAGSDSGGGAGVQADLKTFAAFGVHGMTAITAVTAQNTIGVREAAILNLDLIEAQIRAVVLDIGVDAAKTGMLANPDVVCLVSQLITNLRLPNVVVDPVVNAKGGYTLLSEGSLDIVRQKLLPVAMVVTPNLEEAGSLVERPVATVEDMRAAAKEIGDMGPRWVVVKGGHLPLTDDAVDVVWHAGSFEELRCPRIPSGDTHGTGCTFSAAVAAGLAKGREPMDAIRRAKAYVTEAIRNGLRIGQGHGPVDQLVGVTSPWREA